MKKKGLSKKRLTSKAGFSWRRTEEAAPWTPAGGNDLNASMVVQAMRLVVFCMSWRANFHSNPLLVWRSSISQAISYLNMLLFPKNRSLLTIKRMLYNLPTSGQHPLLPKHCTFRPSLCQEWHGSTAGVKHRAQQGSQTV